MWWQLMAAAVGAWVMALPAVFGAPAAVDSWLRVLGPMAVSTGGIAAAQVTRDVRLLNVPIGIAVAAAPIAGGAEPTAIVAAALSGAALVALAFARGRVANRYGGGWRSLLR